jgi:hypothetical protein
MCVFIPELMRIALVTDQGRQWWPAEVASRSAQLPQNLGGVTSSLDASLLLNDHPFVHNNIFYPSRNLRHVTKDP